MIEPRTDDGFTISRVHHASPQLLFACLTDPVHLTHFWGPEGTHTPPENIVVDLRPGGAFETTMVNDRTGETHTMRAAYLQVDPPRLLSWRENGSGVVTELTFTDLGAGRTEVVTTQRGLPPAMQSPQARAGWETALDRFGRYLAALAPESDRAERLLLVGAAAGPLFVASSLIQAATRAGFAVTQQPPSALSLGDLGWLQIATFLLTGAGFSAGALGLRRATKGQPGSSAAIWLGLFAAALVAGGLFTMDPAFGYPPGTPDGIGADVSWHAAIHGVTFPVGFLALTATGWALSRRYRRQQRRLPQWLGLILGPVVVGLSMLPSLDPNPQGHFAPMWVGVALGFLSVSLALFDARRPIGRRPHTHPDRPERSTP